MKELLAKISMKKAYFFVTAATLFLLLIILLLATRQFFLYRHSEHLVHSSQQLLFQFTGIKEHINDSLLSGKSLNGSALAREIETLDESLAGLRQDILVPQEFKVALVSRMDLIALSVALRGTANPTDRSPAGQQISLARQLRSIQANLTTFHERISDHTRNLLLGLHRTVIGILALGISLISIILLLVNRAIITPLLRHWNPNSSGKVKDIFSLLSLDSVISSLPIPSSSPSEPPGEASFTDWPVKELTRLYRFSSIGHLLAGLSHQLTNLSNGILNYTQALLDIREDLPPDSDRDRMLEKLFKEEKRMAELLAHMITFTSGSAAGEAKILSMEALFDHIKTLVNGSLKTDNITLEISLSHRELLLKHHVSDLELVILSAIQSSRSALAAGFRDENQQEKRILIHDEELSDTCIAIAVVDNAPPWGYQNSRSTLLHEKLPWHDMNFCSHFLHTFGGTLTVTSDEGSGNHCLITIPPHPEIP